MPDTCRADYYGEPCALPYRHPSPVDGYEAHETATGFRWAHHAELVGHDPEDGSEVWDDWDEPLTEEMTR